MEIRDPIYGFVQYDDTEERIINSCLFQRMRNIKQLALTSFVYPGAHHTRFEHCIGAMHLAGRVASKLCLSKARTRTVRLAALLHDIGHGPFSHVSEQVLEVHGTGVLDKYKAENEHELVSILLVLKHPEIAAVLGTSERQEIVSLLQRQDVRSLEKDIISGPLDVDKLDYLLRDSYFAGVKYGMFDLEKVIESFAPIAIGKKGTVVGLEEEGIYAVEQLLLAKYHMNAQVYRHRIRRLTDAMLVRGIRRALSEGIPGLGRLFIVYDSQPFVNGYARWTDEALTDLVLKRSKGVAARLFRRIRDRRLLKEVYSLPINTTAFPDPVMLDAIRSVPEAQLETIASKAAGVYSEGSNVVEPEMVIVDRQTVSNPTFKSPGDKIDTNSIIVKVGKERRSFPEVSSVFRNVGIDPATETLYIYLPLDWIADRDERKRYIEERKESMTEKIRETIG